MSKDLKTVVESEIKKFARNEPSNRFPKGYEGNIFDSPLIGFAQGADNLFELYKEVIGDFHFLPAEFLTKEAQIDGAGRSFKEDEVSVICWVLPIADATRKSNRQMVDAVSERWAITRIKGELFNDSLRRRVVALLRSKGHFAAAPILSKQFRQVNAPGLGYASTWSERHAAYAAGLGTFGLCDGLITQHGKAMRCGSVVANIRIEPSARPYSHHNEYCLHYAGSQCKKCAERCPAEAITPKGHDKEKCREFTLVKMGAYCREHYKIEAYGCGLCQTKVPCEYKLPTAAELKLLGQKEPPR